MWFDVDFEKSYTDEEMISMIRDYIEDMDYSAEVDSILDECYPVVKIAGSHFSPSNIMKELDPVKYAAIVEDEKEHLYNEVKYQFETYYKYEGQKLTEFLDNMISNYFADCYEWKEDNA